MRALVTGGAGFIGSNLVDVLLARGDEVTVLDDFSTGRRQNLMPSVRPNLSICEGKVQDLRAVERVARESRPEVIFHLAAQVNVQRSLADPGANDETNVLGTQNVVEIARALGGPPVVFSSTGGAIYGDAPLGEIPTTEELKPQPLSPYGDSKLAAEALLENAHRSHGQPVSILRYSNVYGPRQEASGEGGVIAEFCNHARCGTRPTIFGDGLQTRDFVYVDDVVRANLIAAESPALGPFNIGTGVETSMLELANLVFSEAGSELSPHFNAERSGEVRRSALDVSLAAAALRWHPVVQIEVGVRRTLAFHTSVDG